MGAGHWRYVLLVAIVLIFFAALPEASAEVGCCCPSGYKAPVYMKLTDTQYQDETSCSPIGGYTGEIFFPTSVVNPPDDGQLYCYNYCRGSTCSNGALEPGEACDRTNLGGATCSGTGTPVCTLTCQIDTSTCGSTCVGSQCITNKPYICVDGGASGNYTIYDSQCCPPGTVANPAGTCDAESPPQTACGVGNNYRCCSSGLATKLHPEFDCAPGLRCYDQTTCGTTPPPPIPANCDLDGDFFNSNSPACGGTDCNDSNRFVYPNNANQYCTCTGALGPIDEICDDSLDNNCDGRIDEGCASSCTQNIVCQDPATIPCDASGNKRILCQDLGDCIADYNISLSCVPAICGNEITEAGETCDDGNTVSGDGCSAQCQIEGAICGDTMCNAASERECLPTGQPVCEDCVGVVDCSVCGVHPVPEDVQVKDVIGMKQLDIVWSVPCTSELIGFTIRRGKFTNAERFSPPEYNPAEVPSKFDYFVRLAPASTHYVDETVENNTVYCYVVDAHYTDDTWSPSEVKCEDVGDEVCLNGEMEDPFCMANIKQECGLLDDEATTTFDEENMNVSTDCGDMTCTVDSKGVADCRAQLPCDQCNGVLGMFWPYDLFIQTFNKDIQHCSAADTCFVSQTYTTTDKYKACNEIESCYDYKDVLSCGDDPCGRTGKNCTWNPIEGEFSAGVCAPDRIELQDCSACAGVECDAASCAAYGECYYDGVKNSRTTTLGCIAKSEFACRYYDTVTECVGVSATSVSVNASWGVSPEERTGGTHAITSRSHDNLSIGLCAWQSFGTSEYCYKNADNHVLSKKAGPTSTERDDCSEESIPTGILPAECFADATAPKTTLDLPLRVGRELFLKYSATDAKTGVRETYYCIHNSTNDCYPSRKLSQDLIAGKLTIDCAGVCTIKYYSEDYARNIEEIRSSNFFADITPPLVVPRHEVNTINVPGTDVYVSNLTMTFLVSDDMNVRCDARLFNEAGTVQSFQNIIDLPPDTDGTYTRNYKNLEDGVYKYSIKCWDEVGNTNNTYELKPYPITIDGDSSITKPLPYYKTFKDIGGITLSIETNRNAACKYGLYDPDQPDDNNYGSSRMHRFNDAGTTHTETLSRDWAIRELGIDPDTSQFIKFWTACDFGGGEITEGKVTDMIRFALDPEGPVVRVRNKDVLTDMYDTTIPKAGQHQFALVCTDPVIKEYYSSTSDGQYEFGCDVIKYSASCTNCLTASQRSLTDGTKRVVATLTINKTTNITYSANDTKNNLGPPNTIPVLVDSEPPRATITIYALTVPPTSVTDLYEGQYTVRINASEPINLTKLELRTVSPVITLLLVPIRTAADEYDAILRINQTKFPELLSNGTMTATFKDKAGRQDTAVLNIVINTKAPKTPILVPALKEYAGLGYNLYEHNGTYYTPNATLKVSGKYEPQTSIAFFVANEYTVQSWFDQTNNAARDGPTFKLRDPAKKGSNIIYLDPGFNIDGLMIDWSGAFLGMPIARRAYGMYDQFYSVVSKEAISTPLGISGYKITLGEKLEQDVAAGAYVKRYESRYPYNHFVGALDLRSFEEEQAPFFAAATSPSGVFVKTPDYSIVFDKTAPMFLYSGIAGHSTNQRRPEITIYVMDPALNTDLGDSKNFGYMLSGNQATYTIEPVVGTFKGYRNVYKITLVPKVDLKDGRYEFGISIMDYARNSMSYRSYFQVNNKGPTAPQFALDPEGKNSPGPGNKYYTKNSNFTAYLGFNTSKVVVVSVRNSANNNAYRVVCTEINKSKKPADVRMNMSQVQTLSRCTFTDPFPEGTYNIKFWAYHDTATGPSQMTENTFTVVVDKTPPEITVSARNITRSGIKYRVNATMVTFEESLVLDITVQGKGPITVAGMLKDRTFIFDVPEDFDWGVAENYEETKNITIDVGDYAGNTKAYTKQVLVDNVKPAIENVTVKPYYVLDATGKYLVVNVADVVFTGKTSKDAIILCPYDNNGTLIEPCAITACKSAQSCIINSTFILKSRIPFFVLDDQAESFITLIATDLATNTNNKTVLIIADNLAPSPSKVYITDSVTPPEDQPVTPIVSGGKPVEKPILT
ncbi:MAG: hypothetical protein ABIA93_02750 [Candidatus Woesearchaeota archaeon]